MQYCKKCGLKLDSAAAFCPKCGTPVENKDKSQSPEDSSDKTVNRVSELYGAVRLDNIPAGYIIDNRYEIKRKLGQGGFGAVYLAYDRKMEVEKALKVIPEVVASDRESMKQLHREAKIMIKLNHPNIVRVYDFNDEGDIKYIDMEYVDGKTLTDLKLEHPDEKLPEAEVVNYAIKIAEAFEYAHRKDILHRDIKPQNVMVTSEGEVKVMDFGIAETVRSSMTRLTGVSSSGTLAYMSPEQLRGKEVGKESDIYSFGAMLYELLSGHPPFYRGDIQYQILNEKPEIINGLSEWMHDLLILCLEKDYKMRCRSFQSLIQMLRKEEVENNSKKNNIGIITNKHQQLQLETVTDIDGNTYKTVEIGEQLWMAENLNVSRFRNGDVITEARSADEWRRAGYRNLPAWCYYDNNPKNEEKYGKLYNWYAVNDPRELAPEGWHIPSEEDWMKLFNHLSGRKFAGKRLKSSMGWKENGNGTNETGFSGVPGGYRLLDGDFRELGYSGFWWSSKDCGTYATSHLILRHIDNNTDFLDFQKELGLSIRCING